MVALRIYKDASPTGFHAQIRVHSCNSCQTDPIFHLKHGRGRRSAGVPTDLLVTRDCRFPFRFHISSFALLNCPMPRLLIISPHFPPTNAPDMQRVRLALPYLRENGWQVEVLAVDSTCVAAPIDEWLASGLPGDVPVRRVRALGLGWSRIPGLGTLTFRALRALRRQGDELLRSGRFELVYFSTTQFGVHALGPRWKRKFRIPFIMDYQDPWVSDYYRAHPQVTPPGGRFKYAVADWLNRRQEPRVLRQCAGITSVSAEYPKQLQTRYPWLTVQDYEAADHRTTGLHDVRSEVSSQWSVVKHRLSAMIVPFPGDKRDLTRAASADVRQTVFSPADGKSHWVYVGVCIQQMSLALRAFFIALKKELSHQAEWRDKLRLHFIGTSYAPKGRAARMVEPLAAEFGLREMVDEHTKRIPYAQALRCLLDADALIVPGSDDPGYTASKIYPYLLARKPLLAVFHENSSVVRLIQTVRGGVVVPFRTGEPAEEIAARIGRDWFATGKFAKAVELDREAFEPHTAPAQARVLGTFFDQILKH
jgi:Glycosyl transferase 4-like domain